MKKTLQWKMSKWLEQALHRSRYPNGLYAYEKELNSVVFDSLQSNGPVDFSRSGSSVYEDSPAKNTGVICHVLFQGIFPTQELNLQTQGSNLCLLHCRQILYHLSHQGSLFQQRATINIHQHISVASLGVGGLWWQPLLLLFLQSSSGQGSSCCWSLDHTLL